MQMCMDELRDRGTLGYETYAPPYICSYAMHGFNIMNQGRRVYWESKSVPNLRLHVIFVAPPGYMKTYYLRQMGGLTSNNGAENSASDNYALFGNTNIAMNPKSNLNEASLVGTFIQQQGRYIERHGEARTHAQEFILVDEFTALMSAMKSNFNAQLDTQLLNALDHGNISKSIAGGNIDYQTYFTLWGGIQPVRYDLSGGLGRRMCFILNIPDKKLKADLRKAVWESKNKRPNVEHAQQLRTDIDNWVASFSNIDTIEYDYSVFELYEELDLEPYELSGFDRLILGWHLAKGNVDKHITLDIEDKDLYNMLIRQHEWRSDIQRGPDLIQVANLIKEYGFQNDEDEHKHYIKTTTLNSVCKQLQMSIQQVNEKVDEMKKYSMIQGVSKGLICYDDV